MKWRDYMQHLSRRARARVVSILFLTLSAFPTLCGATALPYAHPKSYFAARVDLAEPIGFGIQKHLAAVEADLRAYPPPGLSASQRESRLRLLDSLRAYRLGGLFPENTDFPDSLVPYFIDARGVPCAVGYLMIASGHRALAEDFALAANHAYIREIRDARLPAWAAAAGLTLDECARIQPDYPLKAADIPFMQVDSRNRPWIVSGPQTDQGELLLSRWESGTWHSSRFALRPSSFCLVGDKPWMAGYRKYYWNGVIHTDSDTSEQYWGSCTVTGDGRHLWVGGYPKTLRHFEVLSGDSLHLTETFQPQEVGLYRDAVGHLAVTEDRIWAATTEGMATRNLSGGAWTAIDSSVFGGQYLRDLKPGIGKAVWVIASANQSSAGRLLRLDGPGTVTAYSTENSALPDNTILHLAPGRDGSIWMECPSGIFKFTPPDKVIGLPYAAPYAINSLILDNAGVLYASTFANGFGTATGAYRLQADSLQRLPLPVVPGRVMDRKAGGKSGGAWIYGAAGIGKGMPMRTVLGRLAGRDAATGMYRPDPAASP
jgi:hypothetical protein